MKEEPQRVSFAIGRWWSVAVVVVLLAGYTELLDNPAMVDEIQNRGQAYAFAAGDWTVNPHVTVVPGYHVVLAGMCRVTGWTSLAGMRFFTLLFSFGAVAVFSMLARLLSIDDPPTRSLQFVFLPVLFPFLFLLYTDVLSLLLVLSLFFFATRKRFVLAGLFGLLSCGVRQNNVLWVGLALVMAYLEAYGWQWRPPRGSLRKFWPFLVPGLVFVVYVVVNGGVAFGDTAAHPSFSMHLTNVWFLLFISFFLFLPLAVAHRKDMVEVARRWWVWAAGAGLLVLFAFTFINDHPYNLILSEYYLRNRLLIFFTSSWVWKTAFFVPAALAVVFFAVVPLRKNWWLLYPATVFFLVPSWLVEQRYYLIPLTLFLLARRDEGKIVERVQLLWFVVGAIAAFWVINSGRLFL